MQEKNLGFVHKLFEPVKLQRKNIEGKRVYVTEGGEKYTSVTGALGILGKKSLHEWRRRVGFEKANQIARQAASAGTAVHDIAEKYVLGELDEKSANPIALSTFRTIQPYLDQNVDEIYGIELQMYSHELQTAGTADLICNYNGKKTLLDFKTSRRRKKKEDILTYFMQAAAYSVMVKELYDVDIEQIVILMAVHGDNNPVVFVEPSEHYIKMTKKFFQHLNAGEL